mgnify:CR=1 FL=1
MKDETKGMLLYCLLFVLMCALIILPYIIMGSISE